MFERFRWGLTSGERYSTVGGLLRRSAESIAPLNSYLQPLCIRNMASFVAMHTFDHFAIHWLHHILFSHAQPTSARHTVEPKLESR